MKNLFLMSAVLMMGTTSFAGTFSCNLEDDSSVIVTGSVSAESALIKINDEKGVLEINKTSNLDQVIELTRSSRVKEDKYSFAKYYVDFNAWQDIEISVPKKLTGKSFKAFLTIYNDNGDAMVPGLTSKLNCSLN